MGQSTATSIISQIAADESGDSFRSAIRGVCRLAIMEFMLREVEELCGRKHFPEGEGNYRRAGSAPGSIYVDNACEKVKRPRVRKVDDFGVETEHALKSYEAAQSNQDIVLKLLEIYQSGAATRSAGDVFPDISGKSSSEISRLWIKRSAELLSELRDRALDGDEYVAIFVDGVYLSRELVYIVALGVTASGVKKVLDFESGSSESSTVCQNLMGRLQSRGVKFSGRALFIIDGSNALKKGIKSVYPSALIQRCLVHLERNVKAHLSHRHYGTVSELFKKIRLAQGPEEGRRAVMALRNFLRKINHQAWQCVQSAGAEAIAVHLLNIPNSLHASLLSTNNIENIFGTARRKLNRVKRWNQATNMGDRWIAAVLLDAEKGFRKISGFGELPALVAALKAAE